MGSRRRHSNESVDHQDEDHLRNWKKLEHGERGQDTETTSALDLTKPVNLIIIINLFIAANK